MMDEPVLLRAENLPPMGVTRVVGGVPGQVTISLLAGHLKITSGAGDEEQIKVVAGLMKDNGISFIAATGKQYVFTFVERPTPDIHPTWKSNVPFNQKFIL
jgi:hypothetical protein